MAVHRRRDEQHGEQRHRLRERNHREEPDVHEGRAAPSAHLCLAARVVRLQRPPLAAKGLHDADTRQPFLERRQRVGDPVSDRVVDAPGAVVEGPARDDQDRKRDERDCRERRREDDERGDGQCDLQAAADDLDQRLAYELGQRLDVRGQPRHQKARTLALEEAEWKRLQLVERRRPQRAEELFAGARRQQRLSADGEGLHRREAEERDRGDVERTAVVLRNSRVDRVADERGAGERDQRRDDHRQGGAQVACAHRPEQPAGLAPDLLQRCPFRHAASLSSASSPR